MLMERIRVSVSEFVQKLRRAFDVREEKGHDAGRKCGGHAAMILGGEPPVYSSARGEVLDRVHALAQVEGSALQLHPSRLLGEPLPVIPGEAATVARGSRRCSAGASLPAWCSPSSRSLSLSEVTVANTAAHLERLEIVREVTGRSRNKLFAYSKYLVVLEAGTAVEGRGDRRGDGLSEPFRTP